MDCWADDTDDVKSRRQRETEAIDEHLGRRIPFRALLAADRHLRADVG
jgi:hypothetical protein